MFRTASLLILFAACVAPYSSSAEIERSIPLQRLTKTPFFTVDVKVGPSAATSMLVDTGASNTVIFEGFALKKGMILSDVPKHGQDSGGKTFKLKIANVSSLQLGAEVREVRGLVAIPSVPALEGAGISGIFSPQAHFASEDILIDFPQSKLLAGKEAKGELKQRKLVERLFITTCSDKPNGKFAVKVRLNGILGRFYLDTGGKRSVITKDFAAKLGALPKGRVSEREGVRSKRQVETIDTAHLELGKLKLPIPVDIEPKRIACKNVDGKLGGDVLSRYALYLTASRTELSLYE